MRFFVITKKKLLIGAAGIIALCLALFFTTSAITTMANKNKKLPIYATTMTEKKVALTFDSSWGDHNVDALIEIFKKYEIPATFFVTGGWVDTYPDSVKKLNENGHPIMNHSNTHPHMNSMTKEAIMEDITLCGDKIEALTGKRPNLFRAPYGEYNNTVIEACEALKMLCVQWDVDTIDWKDKTADEICARVDKLTKEGSIILCHTEGKYTVDALPTLIENLQTKGYSFVLVDDLIMKENFTLDHEGRQIPITNPNPQ